jgi:hypothetical protein
VAGRRVHVTLRVRAKDVSPRAEPDQGIRAALALVNAEGHQTMAQIPIPSDIAAWTALDNTIAVPANTVSITLVIGLQDARGSASFTAVRVESLPP